jgi:RNA polymerase sigma-70 factor (sigma-E family)
MRRTAREAEYTEYVIARRGHLHRAAYLLCGDAHRAEDLVQTTLVKLYLAWSKIRKDGNVEAFARRIMVNAYIDETRRPWRRRERLGLFTDDPSVLADDSVEVRDALVTALAELPPGQRKVVILRHYWGLSVEETARDLGISTGTVKSQTSAALKRLEAALAPSFQGER